MFGEPESTRAAFGPLKSFWISCSPQRSAKQSAVSEPPPVSSTGREWLDTSIIGSIYALYIVLWCLEMVFRFLQDKLGMSARALWWWLGITFGGLGWAAYKLYELWPLVSGSVVKELCGMGCL